MSNHKTPERLKVSLNVHKKQFHKSIHSPFVDGTSSRPVFETASLIANASALNADSDLLRWRRVSQ